MQGNKLYVGNLTYTVTDEQLEKLFSPHGQVVQINLIGSKGFGFIEMSSAEEAEKAKEALDGSSFEVWAISSNQLALIPGLKASEAAFERLTDYVFEKFREGKVRDYE